MTTSRKCAQALAVSALLALSACVADPEPETDAQAPDATAATAVPEQDAFWASLQALCGNAYAGRISDATPYYRGSLAGHAVMHVMDCSEDRIHIPFHLGDNRSRNWILTRVGGTIRLKHDHRHEDGTEDTVTQYGGDAPIPGLATRQIFPADAHTASILPDRRDNFWFLDFVNDTTLQYGVHWPRLGHSVRFEFDLSRPVEPPPRPWGY